jgi:hypothetical protein
MGDEKIVELENWITGKLRNGSTGKWKKGTEKLKQAESRQQETGPQKNWEMGKLGITKSQNHKKTRK